MAASSMLLTLTALGCGGGGSGDSCTASIDATSNCEKAGGGRRWGAWSLDTDGDGVPDIVNAWNDCGNGGTSPGHPGTLDCPPGTVTGTSDHLGITCIVPGLPLPWIDSCDT